MAKGPHTVSEHPIVILHPELTSHMQPKQTCDTIWAVMKNRNVNIINSKKFYNVLIIILL